VQSCGEPSETRSRLGIARRRRVVQIGQRNRAFQLRYLVRLYVFGLLLKNFAGLPADQLLERMIELPLYAEEKLKAGCIRINHFHGFSAAPEGAITLSRN
jgi:hypothetical protein